jgi:hypothetical protein
MKLAQSSKFFVLALALLLAASAFAASDTHKGNLQFLEAVQVNGKQLPAGEYQVKWEGNGPDVQVTIAQGKKVFATVPGRVVEMQSKSSSDAALLKNNSDGSRTLNEIRFSGKKFSIAVGEEAAQAQMKSGDSSR